VNGDWQSNWQGLCQRLNAQGNYAAAGEALVQRYREPHRAYHNLEHIEECLDEFGPARPHAREPDTLELAIWFHDAVYDSHAGDNEEQSAQLVREFCRSMHLPAQCADGAAKRILVTKTHLAGDDPDAQLLVDIDLSIFGQPRDRFARYEEAIRQEYSWVPEAAFREGRAAILKKFLARAWIYVTPLFRAKKEETARANLTWSLNQLVIRT
jgi:predicted metal-dependent HD superfamily phosphohydrolase